MFKIKNKSEMNCKLSKLFFIALTLGVTYSGKAQTEEERKMIIKHTNVDALKSFAKEREDIDKINYQKAIQKAKELGKPLSGYTERGDYFELVGFYDGTEELKYYMTNMGEESGHVTFFNNTPTKSSLTTSKAHYLHNMEILGQNMIAGEWDGGAPFLGNFGIAGRVTLKDNGATMDPDNGVMHATHVAGTMISSGTGALIETKGFMPQGKLWACNWAQDQSEMATLAGQGLLFSNHSYGPKLEDAIPIFGAGFLGRYSTESKNIDIIANNAPYYTIVKSAGNDRTKYSTFNPTKGGRDLLSGMAVSKNVITVAAIYGIENYTGPNSVQMSSFSNYGPSDDFRIKPDISAKGVAVKSLSNSGAAGTDVLDGTSMASPAVTGGIGLWQQYYAQLFGANMRSSTVKALMAHTALEAGPADGPDHMFGWGVFNVEGGALVMEQKEQNTARIDELTLNTGEVYEYEFDYQGNNPLVATIAWNDPAGNAMDSGADSLFKSLVNDLDLRVVNLDTDEEFLPWALTNSFFSQGNNIAQRMDNNADVIEKVEVEGMVAGRYKIRVSHKGVLRGGSQIYSLILTGPGEPLSVKDEFLSKIEIYPNPVNDVLNVVLPDHVLSSKVGFEVYDLAGRKVNMSTGISNSGVVLNVEGLASGMYILKASVENTSTTFKFVKK